MKIDLEFATQFTGKSMRDVLLAIRDLIINVGWCQKQYCKLNGKTATLFSNEVDSYCIRGAIHKTTHDFCLQKFGNLNYENQIAFNVLGYNTAELITKSQGWPKSLAEWNDQPEMNKEVVLEIINKLINKLEILE